MSRGPFVYLRVSDKNGRLPIKSWSDQRTHDRAQTEDKRRTTVTLEIGNSRLSLEDVERVARGREKVALTPEAVARIEHAGPCWTKRSKPAKSCTGSTPASGSSPRSSYRRRQVREFQKYLIYNHSAGIGEPVSEEDVRAAMLGRIAVHSHGHSGCRPEITQTLVALLNAGVTPVVCEKGSVGACGDLAPMSQIALCMMGEGEAFYQGRAASVPEAMDRAGIPVPGLQARDGLATINGSNLLTGMGCLQLLTPRGSSAMQRSPVP